jgi:hypothetical protein
MAKKKQPDNPSEISYPGKRPELDPDRIRENSGLPEEEPDIIPDEEPFETPPEELPEPGEGP